MPMSNEDALKIVFAGQPKYPPRAMHPEDARDDENDYKAECRTYESAKEQIRRVLTKSDEDRGRYIPD